MLWPTEDNERAQRPSPTRAPPTTATHLCSTPSQVDVNQTATGKRQRHTRGFVRRTSRTALAITTPHVVGLVLRSGQDVSPDSHSRTRPPYPPRYYTTPHQTAQLHTALDCTLSHRMPRDTAPPHHTVPRHTGAAHWYSTTLCGPTHRTAQHRTLQCNKNPTQLLAS